MIKVDVRCIVSSSKLHLIEFLIKMITLLIWSISKNNAISLKILALQYQVGNRIHVQKI